MANSAFQAGSGGIGAGAGIVQLISSSIVPDSSTTGSAFVDVPAGSISITPKKAGNKILVMFSWQQEVVFTSEANAFAHNQILRNGVSLNATNSIISYAIQTVNGIGMQSGQNFNYTDTASDLSPITYQLQQRIQSTLSAQTKCKGLTMTLMEIDSTNLGDGGGGLVPGNPGNPGATTFSEARSAGTASGTGGFVNGIYTTPAGVKSLVVTLVGGGGGGANGITSQPGGNTTFGYLSALGGGSGIGPYTDGFTGGGAGGGTAGATNGTAMTGKPGNVNGLGGVGFLGAGAGGNAYPGGANGGGGGAGGVILEETINTPAATYAYSVGRRGEDQDWAGQYVGQVGCIIVTEYY